MAKTNGWGLVGTGRIADDRILPGINACEGNKLIGVCSRDQGRANAFAAKFGAQHAYTSYEEMLRNPEVTVVAIHTPNSQHADQAIAAARAGKHVFCDKPMATSVADAERIVRECEKAGVKLGVNFHNRFMPCFIDTRRIIESGEIGEVQIVQVEASPGARPGGRLGTWRTEVATAGLGTTYSHRRARLRHPALPARLRDHDGVGVLRYAAQRHGGDQPVALPLRERRRSAS